MLVLTWLQGEDGVIRIGISSSLASVFLAKLIKTFKRAYPTVRLDFSEGSANEHLVCVRRNRLDVTFLTKPPASKEFDSAHLWDEQVLVALPRHHELVDRKAVTWAHLKGQSFLTGKADPGPELRDLLVSKLAIPLPSPGVRQCAVQRDTLMQLVALGKGLALVTASMMPHAPSGIVFRRLPGESLAFFSVWSPNNDNPALRRFISVARALTQTKSR